MKLCIFRIILALLAHLGMAHHHQPAPAPVKLSPGHGVLCRPIVGQPVQCVPWKGRAPDQPVQALGGHI